MAFSSVSKKSFLTIRNVGFVLRKNVNAMRDRVYFGGGEGESDAKPW
jgi:hypothetical protein